MRIFTAAVLLCFAPTLVAADHVKDGLYLLETDGGEGSLQIKEDQASLRVIAFRSCSGSAEGEIVPAGDGASRFVDTSAGTACTIEVQTDAAGVPVSTSDLDGCQAYHGASCGFSGTVIGLDVAFDISAIDTAFNILSAEDRSAVQAVLKEREHYSGQIDGHAGPGTRLAIRNAAREDIAEDATIRLSLTSEVSAYLLRLIGSRPAPDADPVSTVPLADAAPVMAEERDAVVPSETSSNGIGAVIGTWTCPTDLFDEPAEFEFTHNQATVKNLGVTQMYDQVRSVGLRNNALMIEFQNGDLMGIFDIQPNSLILMTDQIIFDCSR